MSRPTRRPTAARRGRAGVDALAVRGEDERDLRGEQAVNALANPALLPRILHPRGAVRERGGEGSKVREQLAELVCVVGEDLLSGPAGREHKGKAGVAPFNEVEEEFR